MYLKVQPKKCYVYTLYCTLNVYRFLIKIIKYFITTYFKFRFADFMKKNYCEIKGQHKYVDYDATSFVKLSCQPSKAEGIGFKYNYEIKFIPEQSKYYHIIFRVPICKTNKTLTTEVVDFKIYENNKEVDYTMRIPVGCK